MIKVTVWSIMYYFLTTMNLKLDLREMTCIVTFIQDTSRLFSSQYTMSTGIVCISQKLLYEL